MDASSEQVRPRPQTRACEACRAAKIKCHLGTQSGICKRCSDLKRECVFRTGPRTRRPKIAPGDVVLPPPPGPSQTFSIQFSMPAGEEPRENFEDLRDSHTRFISELFPSSDGDDEDSFMSAPSYSSAIPVSPFNSAVNVSTPASSSMSAHSNSGLLNQRPLGNLIIMPQFNLDSAEKLLLSFRDILSYYPCIVLPVDASVKSMARDTPFVLLAILAATSCSGSLQGHNLYDEEFKKVLGLKFVAGGERSLELLQGIMIYVAWYPFQLRPKNRQASQYLRMAVDIVHDLELNQEETYGHRIQTRLSPGDIDSMRSFVACYYLNSVFCVTWRKPSTLPWTQFVIQCCDILEQQGQLEQDHLLAWLMRFQHTLEELNTLNNSSSSSKTPYSQSEHHRSFIRKGLESQFREWQSRIPTNLSTIPSLAMAAMFTDMFTVAMPVMRTLSKARTYGNPEPSPLIDPVRLMNTAHTLRTYFDYVIALPQSHMNRFSSADWGHLISSIILGFRLSLPLEICPGFDTAQARQVIQFQSYLERLCKEEPELENVKPGTATVKKADTCTAFRVVLRAVKAKFDKKVVAAEMKAAEGVGEDSKAFARGCPVIDGTLDEYVALWDGKQGEMQTGTGTGKMASSYATSQNSQSIMGVATTDHPHLQALQQQKTPLVFHDLWATMTMGWADGGSMLDLGDLDGVDLIGTDMSLDFDLDTSL